MDTVLHSSKFLSASDNVETLLETPLPEVALVGRSNVGKSSLINALLQRKSLARVGKTPGSTQLICLYELDFSFDGKRTHGILADLPGYGFAKVSQAKRGLWTKTISSYLSKREQLQLVVLLVDARRDLGEEERMLLEMGQSGGIILCLTKVDKLKRQELDKRLAYFKKESGIPSQAIVSVSVEGKRSKDLISPLRETILSYYMGDAE